MNTVWLITKIDYFEKRYLCFPMYDKDEEEITIDKWFIGYGE